MERVGLWVHCFRSLPDHHDLDNQRFFAGCRWIFNPFTEGYDRIRNFLTPRKSVRPSVRGALAGRKCWLSYLESKGNLKKSDLEVQ